MSYPMIQCPACRISYVPNTIFCNECGLYLLEDKDLGTDPFETTEVKWKGEANGVRAVVKDLPDSGSLTLRLRVESPGPSPTRAALAYQAETGRASGHAEPRKSPLDADQARELVIGLAKPVRLGRIDPAMDIFPEIDLTNDLAMEHGVSRVHACIFRRGNLVEVEDLGSTNGTLLNGERLAPFLPVPLKDGDQLQLGKLLIQVDFNAYQSSEAQFENNVVSAVTA